MYLCGGYGRLQTLLRREEERWWVMAVVGGGLILGEVGDGSCVQLSMPSAFGMFTF